MIRFHLGRICWDFVAAKGGSAPPPPDPYVTAGAQTKSNQDTAAYNNAITHGNTTSPLGSQTYTSRVDPTTGATVYDQSIQLAPDQQAIYDAQQKQDLGLTNTANGMLGQVQSAYGNPMDTSGIPQVQSSVGQGQYKTGIDTTGVPGVQSDLNLSNLPGLVGASDLVGARKAAADAVYNQQSSYLDPQWNQQGTALDTKLANQGITLGSEAWNQAHNQFDRSKEFAYNNARNSAYGAGLNELTGLAGIGLNNRQQMYNEAQGAGAFHNNAQQQAYGQANNNADFYNQATGSQNADNLRAGSFNNQAAQQALSQAMTLRNQPMNEFNALRSASQVNMPQFNGAQNSTTNPADIAGNINSNYNAKLNIWNAQQQSSNSLMNGLMGLGGSLGSAAILASDRRLKENISVIGNGPHGLPIYSFKYKDGSEQHIGVMSDDVRKIMPEAVMVGHDGFDRVNYSMVFGGH